MGKGVSKGMVEHTKVLYGGRIGCYVLGCEEPATRWIDMERYGIRRWLSTSYCEAHGDSDMADPHHVYRVRKIEN